MHGDWLSVTPVCTQDTIRTVCKYWCWMSVLLWSVSLTICKTFYWLVMRSFQNFSTFCFFIIPRRTLLFRYCLFTLHPGIKSWALSFSCKSPFDHFKFIPDIKSLIITLLQLNVILIHLTIVILSIYLLCTLESYNQKVVKSQTLIKF